MYFDNLTTACLQIDKEILLPGYLRSICDLLATQKITREKVKEILLKDNINPSIAKVDFLHLIFAYIKIALDDQIITDNEIQEIKFLKNLFNIQRGDFLYHNKSDVELLIQNQLEKIYEDGYVSDKESSLKNAIQEIFDLSYDEMNNYSKIKAAVSLRNGADVKNLDVFFTYEEYFKLRSIEF
jgi:hypothetical protein